MSLAELALTQIALPNNYLTCHVATWYWAALEAVARGLTTAKTPIVRAGNIGGLPGGPQAAMLGLPRVGQWHFPRQGMPGLGMVMLWPTQLVTATHSAISTPRGITGYNQACIFAPHITASSHTAGVPGQLNPAASVCFLIATDTIVRAAGAANL